MRESLSSDHATVVAIYAVMVVQNIFNVEALRLDWRQTFETLCGKVSESRSTLE